MGRKAKATSGFCKGAQEGVNSRNKVKKTHTRQGRCQARSVKILQKEEVEQKPKIFSLSLKPPPVLKTWRDTD